VASKSIAPENPNPDRFDWVWLKPIRIGDKGFPAGFPSTLNADLERTRPRWVLTEGYYVADWLESYCVFSDGKWIGKPFKLLPWEERLLVELFEIDPATLLRKNRWALIGLPKKNGKTELAAALGLYMTMGDGEPAPLVVAAAASEDQADLVFGAAVTMVEQGGLQEIAKAEVSKITVPSSARARMQRIAAAAGTNDGKHIHCVICDELHEWAPGKHERVWNILTNGLGAREQPLIIQITTAGSDEDTVCYRQYRLYIDVRDGVKEDLTFYGVWWETPTHDENGQEIAYDSEDAVRMANPSFGETVKWPFFQDQLTKKTEAVYRRYFLNQWTEGDEIWEGAREWEANAGEPTFSAELPLHVAIDIGLRHDAAAVVWAQWNGHKLQVAQRIWHNPYSDNHPKHRRWRMDLQEVEDHLKGLAEAFPEPAQEDEDGFPLPGPAFYYDPMFFERSAQVLRGEGLAMIDFPQTDMRMVEASQRLFELLHMHLVEHDGDPVMRAHVRGGAVKQMSRGWRITRPTGRRKPTDGLIALAMAAVEATRGIDDEEDEPQLHIGDDRPAVPRGPAVYTFLAELADGRTSEVVAQTPQDALRDLVIEFPGVVVRRLTAKRAG